MDALAPDEVMSLLKVRISWLCTRAILLTLLETQNTYINRLLAVFSMGLAKLSIALLYRRLELYVHGRLYLIPLATAIFWTVFSIFAVAFECHAPSPWLVSSSHCPEGSGLTIAVAVLNFLSDAVLVAFPLPGLWSLAMPIWSRVTVMLLFSSRIM